jgi:hypothetical protein
MKLKHNAGNKTDIAWHKIPLQKECSQKNIYASSIRAAITMNTMKKINIILIFILLITSTAGIYAQTVIRGVVRDAASKQPLQSVSVYAEGGKGVATREDGSYIFATNNAATKSIKFSYIGYKAISTPVTPDKEQTIDVELVQEDATNNVVIKAKRGKYSNKNNPAVELIRKVIDNKDKNRISNYDYIAYEQYEKM